MQERRVEALRGLTLQQLEVAVDLVLGAAHRAQVAEVLDAHRGALEALGQVGGQVLGDLLVDPAVEPVLGAVAEHAQGVVGDGAAVAQLAGVVDLDEIEGVPPRAARQPPQALGVLGDEDLVGVEVHNPVAGRSLEGHVAGGREVTVPRVVQDPRAELLGDLDGAIGRAGVDDDDLVDRLARGLQAAPEHGFLVLDDHAEAERQPLGGAGGRGDALGPGLELADRAGGLRQHAHALAAPAGDLAEVALDVRKLGVQALGGLEEQLGGVQRAELVEGDARVVEQHRLARVDLQCVDRGAGGGRQDTGPGAGGQADLDDRTKGLVAAVDVGDRARLRDQRAVAGPVAGGQAGGRRRAERGGGNIVCGGRAGGSGASMRRTAMLAFIGARLEILRKACRIPKSGDGRRDERPRVQAPGAGGRYDAPSGPSVLKENERA